ncbi:MAG: type II secretion system minor pseudopilin GspK [Oxalobacteraceae bacterium]
MACSARQQRGVAIVTAMLLTTLAITLVASLFWQQQVQVRSIDNQRLQLQKQWVLRGALDWARLILREDGTYSTVDDLTEPWAVPLSETRLDRYVESAALPGEAATAVLSGAIQDAQARLNLSALASHGQINPEEVAAFARLLGFLQQDPALARAAAQAMAQSQQAADHGSGRPRMIRFVQVDDLLAVPGFTSAVLTAIRQDIIFLPRATPVNANTTRAEVLAARLPPLSLADANTLIATRRKVSFRDLSEISARLPGKPDIDPALLSVATSYFLVNGRVAIRQASLQVQALVERSAATTHLLWMHQT